MNARHARNLHPLARLSVLLFAGVMVMLTISLAGAQEATDSMNAPGAPITEEAAAHFIERFDALFNEPNTDIADELFAEDFVGHLRWRRCWTGRAGRPMLTCSAPAPPTRRRPPTGIS